MVQNLSQHTKCWNNSGQHLWRELKTTFLVSTLFRLVDLGGVGRKLEKSWVPPTLCALLQIPASCVSKICQWAFNGLHNWDPPLSDEAILYIHKYLGEDISPQFHRKYLSSYPETVTSGSRAEAVSVFLWTPLSLNQITSSCWTPG